MPSDAVFRLMNSVHRGLLSLSGGRLGWRVGGLPAIELTTTGRKSGVCRPVMLVSPLREGDALVIIASRGGDDQHPSWFLNLLAHPQVTVSTRGQANRTMVARVANDAERDSLWPRIIALAPNYAGYQRKTERKIPVVLLEAS